MNPKVLEQQKYKLQALQTIKELLDTSVTSGHLAGTGPNKRESPKKDPKKNVVATLTNVDENRKSGLESNAYGIEGSPEGAEEKDEKEKDTMNTTS